MLSQAPVTRPGMVRGAKDSGPDGDNQVLARPIVERGVQSARSKVMGWEKGGMAGECWGSSRQLLSLGTFLLSALLPSMARRYCRRRATHSRVRLLGGNGVENRMAACDWLAMLLLLLVLLKNIVVKAVKESVFRFERSGAEREAWL